MRIGRLALALVALVMISTAGCGSQAGPPSIAVGARPDPESVLVANLYAAALRFYGSPAHVQSVTDPVTALDTGEIRITAGFTGRVLARFQPDATARSAMQVYRAMVSALPEGIAAGDYTTSAQDKAALVVTKSTTDDWAGRDVTALVRNCTKLTVGAVAGSHQPTRVGLCTMPKPREFPDDATLFAAVRAGQVTAGWTTTAVPDIPAELVMLSDRTSLIRAENLVPLYRRNELTERQVLALNEVAGVLDTAGLAQMRGQVADGADPGQVADAFIAEHPLGD